MDTEHNEPINEALARLAAAAETEDKEPEVLPGEEEAEQQRIEDKALNETTARNLAAAVIAAMAYAVKTLWKVEYEQKTKDEGTDKLQPCLLGDNMPAWMQVIFGRYWVYLVFGGFLVMTGISTYAIVQERKRKEQEQEEEEPRGQTVDWMQQPATTGEGFSTSGV